MEITLPYPPSANRYWRNFRGKTVRSKEAEQYIEQVGWACKAQGIRDGDVLKGDVSLSVVIYRPRRSGDLDNRLKIVGDALQGIAYVDDKQVVEIHAWREDDKHNPRALVVVREVG